MVYNIPAMNRLADAFNKRKALIAYITAGDPALAVTEKLVYQLAAAGADIVELGIPFSDPLADGPVIQASHARALKKKVVLADVFKLVQKIRRKSAVPLCFMLAYNLVYQYGEEKFYADCARFGVDGVIVPDLPPEEFGVRSSEFGVDTIFLVAPTSSDARIKLITARSSGFVYLVSTKGVTGKRAALAENIAELVARVRRQTKLPLAVGFGVSTPAQARELARYADGVIVGSALVDLIAQKKFSQLIKLVAKLRDALDAG
jgi:tryptophan synthase alpha chain